MACMEDVDLGVDEEGCTPLIAKRFAIEAPAANDAPKPWSLGLRMMAMASAATMLLLMGMAAAVARASSRGHPEGTAVGLASAVQLVDAAYCEACGTCSCAWASRPGGCASLPKDPDCCSACCCRMHNPDIGKLRNSDRVTYDPQRKQLVRRSSFHGVARLHHASDGKIYDQYGHEVVVDDDGSITIIEDTVVQSNFEPGDRVYVTAGDGTTWWATVEQYVGNNHYRVRYENGGTEDVDSIFLQVAAVQDQREVWWQGWQFWAEAAGILTAVSLCVGAAYCASKP